MAGSATFRSEKPIRHCKAYNASDNAIHEMTYSNQLKQVISDDKCSECGKELNNIPDEETGMCRKCRRKEGYQW